MNVPRALQDLYGDLRDRKLLPLVAVLIVATIAVPLLLTAEPPPPPSSETTAAPALDAGELPTAPAVLVANPGLRDYHERLEAMRKKNPFRQVTENLPKSNKGGATEVPTASELGSDPAATSATPADTGASATTTDSGGGGGSPDDSEVSVDVTSQEDVNTGEIRKYWIRHDLDMTIDGPSENRKYENVHELETLPGKKSPILVYVGVTQSERQAVFLVSDDVVKTDGDGTCKPARDDCQVLTLGEGEQRKIWFQGNSGPPQEWIFKLHDLERVLEPLN